LTVEDQDITTLKNLVVAIMKTTHSQKNKNQKKKDRGEL
jgi:hypothetical protein